MKNRLLVASFFLCCLSACKQKNNSAYSGWEVYGGTKEGIRYSSLTEVDTTNVHLLTPAWSYHTGDADTAHHSQIQCNPIVVNGILYGSTPTQKIFAADAATGEEKWVFNPVDSSQGSNSFFVMNNIRGLTYYKGENQGRILFTAGSFLHAVDAVTGKLIPAFGKNGKIDLHEGLDRDAADLFVTFTSPGIIYKDLVIIGSRVDEGPNAAPGHIRAFNAITGKLAWIFHTIPQPGEPGYETWDDPNAWKHIGGANCWSGFTLDEKTGMVFVPTGSASYDFYGGMRKGDNLYADCLLALDAATGKKIWHFQNIHHDVWDKDLPTPPALVTVTRNGKRIEAVAQPTKTGFVYLFERATGTPLFNVEEIPAPQGTDLAGEKLALTQPRPVAPPPFVRQTFSEADVNDLVSPAEQDSLKLKLASLNNGLFSPPSQKGTVIFPGYDGGAEWGGPAFDPATGYIYVNANEMPWILQMKELPKKTTVAENWGAAGQRLYTTACMGCHGTSRQGSGNNPSLINIAARYEPAAIDALLQQGRRMMPAFKHLSGEERGAIISFITGNKQDKGKAFSQEIKTDSFLNLPYNGTGYNKFLTKDGWPAIKPPWGTLNAIDLNTGTIAWKIPIGETKFLKEKGVLTGTENYGGPVVTAGGLIFIAATSDRKIRAFSKRTGKLLWQADLPASGFATPAVYEVKGKQYIVIACGGGKLNTLSGDTYLAFALNDTSR